jgi:glycosyltransferase involved in cell wall biosynthesis
MKIAIASVQVPFISGGAEIMATQLAKALNDHGHTSELITMPFRFSPQTLVHESMNQWAGQDFSKFDCGEIDMVICLKFPTFYLKHPNKVVWLMHQHRAFYELFDTPFGESSKNPNMIKFRNEIIQRDAQELNTAKVVYTISNRVSERLQFYNGVLSTPIHQPPANFDLFRCNDQLDYIFFPSRLESLKRQELLIRAIALCRAPVAIIIAGEGGMKSNLQHLINELELEDRVRLVGRISDEEMRVWYANSLGVFFGPFDEDYGFVTLEAMLSSKPVITCNDSGGPLDFVLDNETGLVVNSTPDSISVAIEYLYYNKKRAKEMGVAGLERYKSLNISWSNVVEKLLR